MFSVSNILCGQTAGNESLRYGHTHQDAKRSGHGHSHGHGGPRKQYAIHPDAPRPVVVWAVTRACNLRCVHCYAAATAEPAPNELSYEEGVTLLEDLANFQVPAVLFSGGEPLARPDTLDLMEHAVKLGLSTTLSTNGLLITDQVADRLAQIGVRYIGVSLDGMRETHDKLRGMQGAFAQTLEAIARCQARGIKVGLRFTVHALNRQYLDDIFSLCIERKINRLCVYHLAYAGRGGKMQKVDLTPEQTRDAVDRLFHLTVESHKRGEELEVLTVGNHADAAFALDWLAEHDPERYEAAKAMLAGTGGNRSGANISSIDPVGDVHYDQFSWHYKVGNVRDQTFAELWGAPSDERLHQLRRRPEGLPPTCQSCEHLGMCNGNLRTRAEAATGDWLGMDPSCYVGAGAEQQVAHA